jgi:hypothetical protein
MVVTWLRIVFESQSLNVIRILDVIKIFLAMSVYEMVMQCNISGSTIHWGLEEMGGSVGTYGSQR